jgi:hypothetical protein
LGGEIGGRSVGLRRTCVRERLLPKRGGLLFGCSTKANIAENRVWETRISGTEVGKATARRCCLRDRGGCMSLRLCMRLRLSQGLLITRKSRRLMSLDSRIGKRLGLGRKHTWRWLRSSGLTGRSGLWGAARYRCEGRHLRK